MWHAACDDFSSLAAVRTFLGALEAGCDLASMIIFGMYYTRAEQPLRMGIWIGFGGVAYILGGILATESDTFIVRLVPGKCSIW